MDDERGEDDRGPTVSIVDGARQLRRFYGARVCDAPPCGDNFATSSDARLVRDLAAFFAQFDDSPAASEWERAAREVYRQDASRARNARRRRELLKFGVIDGGGG
jgi:hypothetical protein